MYLVEIISGMVGERLALKLLSSTVSADAEKRDRFLNEIRLAMKLVDKNIVTIRDVGTSQNGQPYFTMDYCPGETLAELLSSEAPLEVDRAVSLVRTILGGLETAHDQGIIHRDLKPANFIVEDTDAGETVRILDFGIATAFEPGGERSTKLIGSPRYMAPEQFVGEPVTYASDLYAMGVVLYECLTGERPHEGDSTRAILNSIQRGEIPLPQELCPELEYYPMLVEVVLKAMENNPEKRFQTVREFGDALERALKTPRAHPSSSSSGDGRRGRRSGGRRSGSHGMTAPQQASVLVGLAVMGLAVWWFVTQKPRTSEPDSPATAAVTPNDSAEQIAQQGYQAFKNRQYSRAVTLLTAAQDAGDRSRDLMLTLAEALYLADSENNRNRAEALLTLADTPRADSIRKLLDYEGRDYWTGIVRELRSARSSYGEDRVVQAFVEKAKERETEASAPVKVAVVSPKTGSRGKTAVASRGPVDSGGPAEEQNNAEKNDSQGADENVKSKEAELVVLREQAGALSANGKHEEAEPIWARIVEQGSRPDDALRWASCSFAVEKYRDAYAAAEEALDGDVDGDRIRFDLALIAAKSRLRIAALKKKSTSMLRKVNAHLKLAGKLLEDTKGWADRKNMAAEVPMLRARSVGLSSSKTGSLSALEKLVGEADRHVRSEELDYEHGLSYYLFFKRTRGELKDSAATNAAKRLNDSLQHSSLPSEKMARGHEMIGHCRLHLESWSNARSSYGRAIQKYEKIEPPLSDSDKRISALYRYQAISYVKRAESSPERLRDSFYRKAIKDYKNSFKLRPSSTSCWKIVRLFQLIDNDHHACKFVLDEFKPRQQKWKKKPHYSDLRDFLKRCK